MVSSIIWILALPRILYHCFYLICIVILLVCYKLYTFFKGSRPPSASLALRPANYVGSKLRFILNKSRIMARQQQQLPSSTHLAPNQSMVTSYHCGMIVALLLVSSLCTCRALEQDAEIVRPVQSLAKGLIQMATLGTMPSIDFTVRELSSSLAKIAWKTGLVFGPNSQLTYEAFALLNRVTSRVYDTNVKLMFRKSLPALKEDLDAIVDGIVEQVRQSPEGLRTNYLETQVKGKSLEDALVDVGLQFKAYGIDVAYYRELAGKVLGIPLMPTFASTAVNVANLAPSIETLSNATPGFIKNPISQGYGAAMGATTQVSKLASNLASPLMKGLIPSRTSSSSAAEAQA